MTKEFDPKIVGFFCNWCTSAAADLAGTLRMEYPSNVRSIRVMCTGSIDPTYILHALLEGADGVLIGGCHPGDCHYVSGNLNARRRITVVKSLLKTLGLGEERVRLEWIGASEGKKFVEVIQDFTAQIKKIGPNPISQKGRI
ncbi:hydrogenase iron-sulfur subunit [Candidatus Altiarchaeota archaeon]